MRHVAGQIVRFGQALSYHASARGNQMPIAKATTMSNKKPIAEG